MVWMLWMF